LAWQFADPTAGIDVIETGGSYDRRGQRTAVYGGGSIAWATWDCNPSVVSQDFPSVSHRSPVGFLSDLIPFAFQLSILFYIPFYLIPFLQNIE
jgi:hypothetical protein